MNKRFISAVMCGALMLGCTIPAFAADNGSDVTLELVSSEAPEQVKVTIPSTIPLEMDEEGAVKVARSDVQISNNSETIAVKVTDVTVEGQDDWVIKDFSSDLSARPTNTHELAMSFRGDGTADGGKVTLTDSGWNNIEAGTQLNLQPQAKIPLQDTGFGEPTNIAQVNYTIACVE